MILANSSASLVAGAVLLWGPPSHASAPTHAGTIYPSFAVQQPLHLKARVERETCPNWAEYQFEKVSSLREHWHEFDADPIQPKTIFQLKALMAAARNSGEHTGHIVPGADGSLQAEWHLEDVIIGALVEDDGNASVWARFVNDDAEVEEFGLNSVDFLRSLAVAYRLDV